MSVVIVPEQMTSAPPDQSARELRRQGRDLEAQLSHARQEQDRTRRKLQRQLLTVTLENAERQRGLEARLENILAELSDTRAERDQIRQDLETRLASAMVERTRMEKERTRMEEERTRMEKDYQDRLAEQDRRRLRLEDELKGLYSSLSWRLTAPLRWLKARFTRRKRP